MTARAVYVCRDCPWGCVAKDGANAEQAAAAQANAHQNATGHQTVLHRPKMPWEVG